MTDDMIPSEATMAGCVAQSIDGYVECTCPNDAGICIDCMTNEIENLRRQLAQAQARENAALAREARLRELWGRYQWDADGCPECGEFESDGHADWCELAAALSALRASGGDR